MNPYQYSTQISGNSPKNKTSEMNPAAPKKAIVVAKPTDNAGVKSDVTAEGSASVPSPAANGTAAATNITETSSSNTENNTSSLTDNNGSSTDSISSRRQPTLSRLSSQPSSRNIRRIREDRSPSFSGDGSGGVDRGGEGGGEEGGWRVTDISWCKAIIVIVISALYLFVFIQFGKTKMWALDDVRLDIHTDALIERGNYVTTQIEKRNIF